MPENEKTPESAIIKIYNEINNVIGGTNPNELFCLTMPGMVINAEDYTYDTRFEKPFKVIANESRLVNKLYDPYQIVGSDNGRLLATQYKSALDSLSPKINKTLIQAKNELRKMLSMPTTYTTDDGKAITMSFQQLFYKLYEEYVDEKQRWSELQNKQREMLLDKYPNDDDESKQQRQEKYLEWYQTVAESNLLKINMKHGKVLALFSDNDMKIIEGVLDSGVGAELQEAREQILNSRKYDPDGGYVYPVKLEPSDWFKSLTSSFSFIDLLKTSEHYALKYEQARKNRDAIALQIQLLEGSDKSSEVNSLIEELETHQKALNKVTSELDKTYGEGFSTCADTVMNIYKFFGENKKISTEDEKHLLDDVNNHVKKSKINPIPTIDIKAIISKMDELDAKQREFDQASMKVTEYAAKVILAKTSDYSKELKTLYSNFQNANEELDAIKEDLKAAMQKEQGNLNEQLFPNAVESRFEQVNIAANSSEMKQSSHSDSHASESSVGVNFLFGGYHSSSHDENAHAQETLDSEDFKLEIGFLATKVNITRNWFNPGVFLLSSDMYHTSKNRLSLGDIQNPASSQCVFPCYPTSFVIAKDVSIKISSGASHMNSMKSMMEKHASKGGGFLCFKGNKSSSDSSSDSAMVSTSSDNSVIIKIPGPQVIGYYLQSTPKDNSEAYIKDSNEMQLDMMITDFVTSYRQILQEKNPS